MYKRFAIVAWALAVMTAVIGLLDPFEFSVWFIAAPLLVGTFVLAMVVLMRGGTVHALVLLVVSVIGVPLMVARASYVAAALGISSREAAVRSGEQDPRASLYARKQAQEMVDALLKNDVETSTRLTNPRIIEFTGGREKMMNLFREGKEQMTARGMTLEQITVGQPSFPVRAGNELFIVVPHTLRLKTPQGVLVDESYYLGVSSNGGRNWTFVDGQGMNDQTVKQFFPNLPAELTLPPKSAPRLIAQP